MPSASVRQRLTDSQAENEALRARLMAAEAKHRESEVKRHEIEQRLAEAEQQHREVEQRYQTVKQQLDGFRRQMFGRKSERLLSIDPAVQLSLFSGFADELDPPEPPARETMTYQQRKKARDGAVNDTGLRFDANVPVRVVEVAPPEGLEDGEVIGVRSTFRLAQRRASFVIIEYRCPVIKPKGADKPVTTPAPGNVFAGSLADVSLLAGMTVDKFLFHLPLNRQHQRLKLAGIQLSRATLTKLVMRVAALLAPIHQAQLEHVLLSRVLAMDETPIKAGRGGKGKMKVAWFWPLYGEDDEISFTYARTRARSHIEATLAEHFRGVLLTDGYAAYARYAASRSQIRHAQCWSHTRRGFERAGAESALQLIAELYRQEGRIRDKGLTGADKLAARREHCQAAVDAFWQWCERQLEQAVPEPQSLLSKALHYALERRDGLEVFLSDPEVAIDTNHLERGIRPIAMGKRNWLFCSSEVGAEAVGIIQSLIGTCRLHGIDPYTYLVDMLQRVGQHPASDVISLTPRVWKQRFAEAPLTSDLDRHER